MITIDQQNNITISKGDTLALRFRLSEGLQEGDKATLTISSSGGIELQAEVAGPVEKYLDVVVSAEDMAKLKSNYAYIYDLCFTFADGRVFTADWARKLKLVNTAHPEVIADDGQTY